MGELYGQIMDISFMVAAALVAITSLRLVEFIYKYAKAIPLDPKDDMMYSMYWLRIAVVGLSVVEAFVRGKSWDWAKDQMESDIFDEPVTSHPGGIVVDMLCSAMVPILIAAASPLLLIAVVVGVPLQMMHIRSKRKLEFLDKLKGVAEEE